jgi:YggT family protein
VSTLFYLIDRLLAILRPAFFWLAILLAVLFALDWAVRTRRISPFGPLAQFLRKYIDPIIAPVERRIVRAGGMPHTAPWWTLAAVVIGGIVVLWLLDLMRTQLAMINNASSAGPVGLVRLLIQWTFMVFQLALLVRVLSSWISVSPYSKWVRWSYVLSEPILRPLRQIIPLIGMIDITPIIAYFLLSFTASLLLSII